MDYRVSTLLYIIYQNIFMNGVKRGGRLGGDPFRSQPFCLPLNFGLQYKCAHALSVRGTYYRYIKFI